jgi:hypothetical protein
MTAFAGNYLCEMAAIAAGQSVDANNLGVVNAQNLTVLAPDSTKRFKLWVMLQQPPDKELSADQKKKLQELFDSPEWKNLKLIGPLHEIGWSEWEAAIIWSWGDMGPMEPEVQKEIKRLDAETTHNMYSDCIWPGGLLGRAGRACVMQKYACDAARNKFDKFAFEMTAATQLHNGTAVNALRAAGVWKVAEFIRNNRGCHSRQR